MKKIIALTLALTALSTHAEESPVAGVMRNCASLAESVTESLQSVGVAKSVKAATAMDPSHHAIILSVVSAAAEYSSEEFQSRAAYEACMEWAHREARRSVRQGSTNPN